jgi:HAD superfamily hydrolase (TIGR01549 family)
MVELEYYKELAYEFVPANGVYDIKKNAASIQQQQPLPRYSRSELKERIVHLGVGSKFFRSHLCVYIEELLSQNRDCDWGICGVSLITDRICKRLQKNDHLYEVVVIDSDTQMSRTIGSIISSHYAPEETATVLSKIASEDARLLTLTITEPGYCYNAQKEGLDLSNACIQNDLKNFTKPQSAIGYIVCGLAMRRQSGTGPLTILSCDNLCGNGDILKCCLVEFANHIDPSLAEWIKENAYCPNTMVDRITPVTTKYHERIIKSLLGRTDPTTVITEKFSQFVIQENPMVRSVIPDLESVGIQIVPDAKSYFMTKLLCLNGSHVIIAAIGARRNMKYIHESIGNHEIQRFVRQVMDYEFTPLLVDNGLDKYKDTLIKRFNNVKLYDTVERVGAEMTRKVRKYILTAIRKAIENNSAYTRLCMVVALYLYSLSGMDDFGNKTNLKDPLLHEMSNVKDNLQSVLGLSDGPPSTENIKHVIKDATSLFGSDLTNNDVFLSNVASGIRLLHHTKDTIKSLQLFSLQNKKAVVFDCDMTLVDSSVGTHLCVNWVMEQMGHKKPFSYEQVKKTIGLYMTESYGFLTGDYNKQKADEFTELFLKKEVEKPSVINENLILFDPVHPLMNHLKQRGCKLGIVTSKHREALNDILDRFDLQNTFEHTVTGDEVVEKKPAPDGLLYVIDKLGLDREQVLYVGDSFIDAMTAQRAKVDFVGVTTGTTDREQFEKFPYVNIVDDLSGLHEMFLLDQVQL